MYMDDMFCFVHTGTTVLKLVSTAARPIPRAEEGVSSAVCDICHGYCLFPAQNGSARSLSVALEVFAALFPNTRPSRRQSLSQSLFPVLLRLLSRAEEGLHEALQESLSHILPTMTPFISAANIQVHCIYHVMGQMSHVTLGS